MKNESNYNKLLDEKKYFDLLELILSNRDIDYLRLVLSVNEVLKTLSQFGDYFLGKSYINKDYIISEFLLSYGVNFNIKHFLYLDRGHDKNTAHLRHLHHIKPYLSEKEFDSAFNLIVAFYSYPTVQAVTQDCYRIEDILIDATHLNSAAEAQKVKEMFRDLYISFSPIVKDILTIVALTNLEQPLLKLYMPMGNSAYLDSAQASNNQIYFPISKLDNKEKSFIVHELGHYALEILFKNEALPYPVDNINIINEYHYSTKKCLMNVFALFNLQVNDADEVYSNNSITIREVLDSISGNVPLHIFSFEAFSNHKAHNDRLAKAFLGNHGMSDEHKSKFLKHFMDNISNNYHFDEDDIYFLSRMSDFSLRENHELDYEFIVRIGELEVYGLKDSLMSFFNEGKEYWKKFIHPEVEKLRASIDMHECAAFSQDAEIDLVGNITP